jgi:hypothetical protein
MFGIGTAGSVAALCDGGKPKGAAEWIDSRTCSEIIPNDCDLENACLMRDSAALPRQENATGAPAGSRTVDPRRRPRTVIVAFVVATAMLAATFVIINRHRSPSSVTRHEALAIAEQYVVHEWTPSETNAFHGVDLEGIRVDTPDAFFQSSSERGWWMANQRNVGMPYKWGGFDTPEEFDRGLRDGQIRRRRLQRGKATVARCCRERACGRN